MDDPKKPKKSLSTRTLIFYGLFGGLFGGLAPSIFDDGMTNLRSQPPVTVEMIDEVLTSNPFRVQSYQTFKQLAPNEYQRFLTYSADEANSLKRYTSVLDGALPAMQRLLVENAYKARTSSDDNLKSALRAYIALLEELSAVPTECNIVLESGVNALPSGRVADLLPFTDPVTAATLRVFFDPEGRVSPREDPTKVALEHALKIILKSKLSVSDLKLAVEADFENPEFCQATINFYQAVLSSGGENGERMRAQMITLFPATPD